MNIQLTDGGRLAAGYVKERRDCAVRALANAADIPYYQAHEVFKWGGRRNRCASYHTIPTLTELGLKGTRCRISLSSFLIAHPKGSFYIIKAGHAFAVRDGVIFDETKVSKNVIVKWFAEVK
jgi:hypothetical protein